MPKKTTSWGDVAGWYDELLKGEGTYQNDLILPNLKRLMDIKRGETILDLACGQGFFAREFHAAGAKVIGVDLSPELVKIAVRESPKDIKFYASQAGRLNFISNNSIDAVTVILAAQNMDEVHKVFQETNRVLKKDGRLFLVLNHPAFRVPKVSSWGWDEQNKTQYRRVDEYLSESKIKIQIHPGNDPEKYTLSFHRPLQFYFKTLHNAGFCVSRLEEWNSHKKSQLGPRSKAEDRARKEIPLFLFIEAVKCAK